MTRFNLILPFLLLAFLLANHSNLFRSEEAEEQYRTALRYEDDNPDLYYNVSP